MAEGGSRGKVLCRFYAINTCYKGENCPYSHDRALLDSLGHSSSQTSVNIPCKYFAAGSCNRGSDCRFSHDSALPPPQIEQIPNFTVPAQWPGNMQIRYAHIDPLQLNMGQAPVRYVANQPQRTLLMPGNPAMNIRGPGAAVQGPVAPEASLSAAALGTNHHPQLGQRCPLRYQNFVEHLGQLAPSRGSPKAKLRMTL